MVPKFPEILGTKICNKIYKYLFHKIQTHKIIFFIFFIYTSFYIIQNIIAFTYFRIYLSREEPWLESLRVRVFFWRPASVSQNPLHSVLPLVDSLFAVLRFGWGCIWIVPNLEVMWKQAVYFLFFLSTVSKISGNFENQNVYQNEQRL